MKVLAVRAKAAVAAGQKSDRSVCGRRIVTLNNHAAKRKAQSYAMRLVVKTAS
jgi:hypothetical protein